MNSSQGGTYQRSCTPEDVILEYRPGLSDNSLLRNLPAVMWAAVFVFLLVYGAIGGGTGGIVVGLAAVAAGLWAMNHFAAPSVSVVVRAEGLRILHPLGKHEIRLDEIARLKIARHSKWAEARVALERKGAKKGFFALTLRTGEIPVPGDTAFQVKVVAEILKRRGDIPMEKDTAELLAGTLELPWRHRLPVVIAIGATATVTVYLLVVSMWKLGAPIMVVLGAQTTALFSASAMSLKRESKGKATVASVGFSVVAVMFVLFLLANAYGYLEYMPLIYAISAALAVAGLLASLPLPIRPRHLAVGEAVLLVALVAAAWSVGIRGTIPVREVRLAPTPTEAYFSTDGDTIIAYSMAGKTDAVHFVDRRSGRSSSVSLESFLLLHVPVASDAMLGVKRSERRGELELWLIRAGREPEPVLVDGSVNIPSRAALSPDGGSFAFFVSEGREQTERKHAEKKDPDCRLCVLDLETLAVRDAGLVLRGSPSWSHRLTWRADGRFVWADVTEREWNTAKFELWSWRPGEEAPRLDFESKEEWSKKMDCSPGFRKAVVLIHVPDGETACVVDLESGEKLHVQEARPEWSIFPGRCWSADGGRYAYLPEENPRSVVMLDTVTGGTSVVRSPTGGKIANFAISSDGTRLAFCTPGSVWNWSSAFYVANLDTGAIRRLRPLPGLFASLHLAIYGSGILAWSPDGDTLAVAVYAFPLAAFVADRAGSVWIVDQLP